MQYNKFDIKKFKELLNNSKTLPLLEEIRVVQGEFLMLHPLDYLHYKYSDNGKMTCKRTNPNPGMLSKLVSSDLTVDLVVTVDPESPLLSEVIKCLS
jgi:hypothetical protein